VNSGVTTELNSSSNIKIGIFNYGWACGVNGVVIKSTTSSGQWVNVSGNGIPSNVSLDNIWGLDDSIAFVAGHLNSNTWVWKTTNGGQNWFQVFTQPNGRINAVWMKNYVQGFMQGNPVGGRWSLWKTTNGGNSWDSTALYLPQAGNELGWPNSLYSPLSIYYPSIDSNKIWFGTNNYRIYYSSNYGQSWSIQALPLEQNIVSLAYCYNYQGAILYAGGSSNLFKSTNYGLNWIIDTVGGTGSITGITYTGFNFYLTRGNKVYLRNSYWHAFWTAPAGNYKYLDNRGSGNFFNHYGVRSNGGITLITEGLGVKKISSEISSGYSISQNYPNPFNPSTKIKFSLPSLSKGEVMDVRLIVYDVLGREISNLIPPLWGGKEGLSPGTYEVEWDGINYPSGVYFYKLITSEYTETRKMVLLK
jgi:photosystem II stability/assembly factor-like uncharacterized protein